MPLRLHYGMYETATIYESPIDTPVGEYRIVSGLQPQLSLEFTEEDQAAVEISDGDASDSDLGSETIPRAVPMLSAAEAQTTPALFNNFSGDLLDMLGEKLQQIGNELAETEIVLDSIAAEIQETKLKRDTIGDFHADRNWFMRKGQLEMELGSLYARADRLRKERHNFKLQLIDVQRSYKVCKRRVKP